MNDRPPLAVAREALVQSTSGGALPVPRPPPVFRPAPHNALTQSSSAHEMTAAQRANYSSLPLPLSQHYPHLATSHSWQFSPPPQPIYRPRSYSTALGSAHSASTLAASSGWGDVPGVGLWSAGWGCSPLASPATGGTHSPAPPATASAGVFVIRSSSSSTPAGRGLGSRTLSSPSPSPGCNSGSSRPSPASSKNSTPQRMVSPSGGSPAGTSWTGLSAGGRRFDYTSSDHPGAAGGMVLPPSALSPSALSPRGTMSPASSSSSSTFSPGHSRTPSGGGSRGEGEESHLHARDLGRLENDLAQARRGSASRGSTVSPAMQAHRQKLEQELARLHSVLPRPPARMVSGAEGEGDIVFSPRSPLSPSPPSSSQSSRRSHSDTISSSVSPSPGRAVFHSPLSARGSVGSYFPGASLALTAPPTIRPVQRAPAHTGQMYAATMPVKPSSGSSVVPPALVFSNPPDDLDDDQPETMSPFSPEHFERVRLARDRVQVAQAQSALNLTAAEVALRGAEVMRRQKEAEVEVAVLQMGLREREKELERDREGMDARNAERLDEMTRQVRLEAARLERHRLDLEVFRQAKEQELADEISKRERKEQELSSSVNSLQADLDSKARSLALAQALEIEREAKVRALQDEVDRRRAEVEAIARAERLAAQSAIKRIQKQADGAADKLAKERELAVLQADVARMQAEHLLEAERLAKDKTEVELARTAAELAARQSEAQEKTSKIHDLQIALDEASRQAAAAMAAKLSYEEAAKETLALNHTQLLMESREREQILREEARVVVQKAQEQIAVERAKLEVERVELVGAKLAAERRTIEAQQDVARVSAVVAANKTALLSLRASSIAANNALIEARGIASFKPGKGGRHAATPPKAVFRPDGSPDPFLSLPAQALRECIEFDDLYVRFLGLSRRRALREGFKYYADFTIEARELDSGVLVSGLRDLRPVLEAARTRMHVTETIFVSNPLLGTNPRFPRVVLNALKLFVNDLARPFALRVWHEGVEGVTDKVGQYKCVGETTTNFLDLRANAARGREIRLISPSTHRPSGFVKVKHANLCLDSSYAWVHQSGRGFVSEALVARSERFDNLVKLVISSEGLRLAPSVFQGRVVPFFELFRLGLNSQWESHSCYRSELLLLDEHSKDASGDDANIAAAARNLLWAPIVLRFHDLCFSNVRRPFLIRFFSELSGVSQAVGVAKPVLLGEVQVSLLQLFTSYANSTLWLQRKDTLTPTQFHEHDPEEPGEPFTESEGESDDDSSDSDEDAEHADAKASQRKSKKATKAVKHDEDSSSSSDDDAAVTTAASSTKTSTPNSTTRGLKSTKSSSAASDDGTLDTDGVEKKKKLGKSKKGKKSRRKSSKKTKTESDAKEKTADDADDNEDDQSDDEAAAKAKKRKSGRKSSTKKLSRDDKKSDASDDAKAQAEEDAAAAVAAAEAKAKKRKSSSKDPEKAERRSKRASAEALKHEMEMAQRQRQTSMQLDDIAAADRAAGKSEKKKKSKSKRSSAEKHKSHTPKGSQLRGVAEEDEDDDIAHSKSHDPTASWNSSGHGSASAKRSNTQMKLLTAGPDLGVSHNLGFLRMRKVTIYSKINQLRTMAEEKGVYKRPMEFIVATDLPPPPPTLTSAYVALAADTGSSRGVSVAVGAATTPITSPPSSAHASVVAVGAHTSASSLVGGGIGTTQANERHRDLFLGLHFMCMQLDGRLGDARSSGRRMLNPAKGTPLPLFDESVQI